MQIYEDKRYGRLGITGRYLQLIRAQTAVALNKYLEKIGVSTELDDLFSVGNLAREMTEFAGSEEILSDLRKAVAGFVFAVHFVPASVYLYRIELHLRLPTSVYVYRIGLYLRLPASVYT